MRTPLRVLEVLATATPGGASGQVSNLVRHLPRDEFEPIVAVPRDGVLFDRLRDLGVRVMELPSRPGWRHVVHTKRLISSLGVDLVHTHGTGPGVYGRVAARWARVPAVHTLQDVSDGAYAAPERRRLERALSRVSHTIIMASASQHAEAIGLGLFRPGQGVVIASGVDLDEMKYRMARSSIRRDTVGFTRDQVVIGTISRFDPGSQLDVLVEALQRSKARLPQLALVLVGSGTDEARIRRLVFERGLQPWVVFTGSVAYAAHLYPVFDLFVAPSRSARLSLSLIEAMAAGLPVVATDIPGHRDVVVHGETGVLVAPGETTALSDAIASLVSAVARRRIMGEAGRRRAHKEFAIGPMAEATAWVYRRAAAGPRGTPVESTTDAGLPRVA